MNLEQAQALLVWDSFENEDDFEREPVEHEIVDKSRWEIFYQSVYFNKKDNTYWKVIYAQGATEHQDEGPEVCTVIEVKPTKVLVTKYVEVQS